MNLHDFIDQGVAYALPSVKASDRLVRAVQVGLNSLGYNAGPVDGQWGPKTDSAYRRFCLAGGFPYEEFTPAIATALLTLRAPQRRSPTQWPAKDLAVGAACLRLIRFFEGRSLTAYRCSANEWTIGYGHTAKVRPGDRITPEEAERLLKEDVEAIAAEVRQCLKAPVTANEFNALVSFAFNVGGPQFAGSTLLRLVNKGDRAAAADEFLRWVNVNGEPEPGLVNRRQAERALFLDQSEV